MGILFRYCFWMLATVVAGVGLTGGLRPSSFSFDSSGISNRFITPNGDGLNDNVVLTFSNPRDSSVRCRIYDMKGAFVAEMAQGPVPSLTLEWDATSHGTVVAEGVYVYVLEAEDKVFTGTLMVIR